MFVWSMKTTRPRLAVGGIILGLLLTVMIATGRGQRAQTAGADGADAARVAYLKEQGYAVEPQWTDVRELVLPDAEPVPAAYRGERVKCFTYATADGGAVCLYEYNGKILAALPAKG